MVAGPQVAGGRSCATLVEMVDLLPTVLNLAAVEPHHTHFGHSLLTLLSDPEAPHRDAAYSEGGHLPSERHALELAPPPYDRKAGLQQDDSEAVAKAVAMRMPEWTYVRRLYDTDSCTTG